MNDEEYANDHKTGGMYETAEFLYSLRELVPKHQYEAAGCDGDNGRYHGPGKKLLADVELTEPGVPERNIIDPQAFDTVKKSSKAPAVFRPDRPIPDVSELDHNKWNGHYEKKQSSKTMDDACDLQAGGQPLVVSQARGGQVRIHAPDEIVG